jgi:periplasmic protein TonB
MNQNRMQNPLLLGFIILSLILHLLLLYLVPAMNLSPKTKKTPDRVVVTMRPVPTQQERELDLTPEPKLNKPRETPAKRLAETNQVVAKEQAPQGDAFEDTRPDAPAPAAAKPSTTIVARQAEAEPSPDTSVALVEEGHKPAVKPEASALPQTTLPNLSPEAFLTLPEATKTRMAQDFRQKYRKDVEKGDAVWLDTEQDLLFSIFERLRTNIYNVWNYPEESSRRGEAGTCLLRFTLNRSGDLIGTPEVLESSGFTRLDKEAVAAVRKGASYGPLSRFYEKDSLTIMAFFRYDLKRIGTRRPGDIFGN